MKKRLLLYLLVLLSAPLSNCKKEENLIPNVQVNLVLYLSEPAMAPLNTVGGHVYITGGVRGILVYRSSQTDFVAYERNCPYQPQNSCARIEVDSTGLLAVDKCCGSEFLLYDGGVVKGPSTRALKPYQTNFTGSTLQIYN